MPYCINCGSEIEDTWNVCTNCGKALKEQHIPQQQTIPQVQPQPQQTHQSYQAQTF
ncbi:MAG: zinc-ribbon domain-containing protein, partial [Promethearchaeota archaeon]